jgi:hypothetical protein
MVMTSKPLFGIVLLWTALGKAQLQNPAISIGYTPPPAFASVAAGQLVTLFLPPLNVPDAVATGTPLPSSLSGVSVAVHPSGVVQANNYPTSLPMLRVYTEGSCQLPNPPSCPDTQITVQM